MPQLSPGPAVEDAPLPALASLLHSTRDSDGHRGPTCPLSCLLFTELGRGPGGPEVGARRGGGAVHVCFQYAANQGRPLGLV